jgi:glycosyltransferase involved in cell wall biosynthesis
MLRRPWAACALPRYYRVVVKWKLAAIAAIERWKNLRMSPKLPKHSQRPIAIYIPAFNGGGAENAIIRLLNYWHDEGQEVILIVNCAKGPLQHKLNPTIPVHELGYVQSFANLPRLIRFLRKSPPKLLVTALLSPNVVGVLAAAFVRGDFPVVCLVRNHSTQEFENMPAWRRALIRPLTGFAYRRADGIGCVASEVSRDLIESYGLDPAFVMDTFNPIPISIAEPFQRPLVLCKDSSVVLAIGRLVNQKDYPTLLRAFAQVRKSRDAQLVILGDGPLADDLIDMGLLLGISEHVRFMGFRENPNKYLAHADVFVLLSLFEGFPNVLGEALGMGCTVVATDAPGGTADILDGGRFGELVPCGDSSAAAAAIIRALDAPLPREAQMARAREYSIERIAARYNALFDRAMARKAA